MEKYKKLYEEAIYVGMIDAYKDYLKKQRKKFKGSKS